ncbi:hypothetical protein L6164_002265 [Bauhinia variegata]|uniref:Uncharacterized protein n=1 Tax=Bauhinia variegata TaxID=167791 RepID=A0ACB9PXP3_BAUVA|nr:hypothetical protein L6164_002265 [Bauhinia variegata]
MVMKERDEELALFLEMRRREKENEKNNFLLLQNSDDLDASNLESNLASSPASKTVSAAPPRKTGAEEFLNSENDKTDYDWLLAPPDSPLFPTLEKDSQIPAKNETEIPNRKTALKPRLANIPAEPAARGNVATKHHTVKPGLGSSITGNRRPSSSGGNSRPSTPSARPTLPSTTKSSRPSTPTSRAVLTSTKPTAPAVRSSTPTRSTARASTPTSRPSLGATAPKTTTRRSSTPTLKSSTSSIAPGASGPPPMRSSSASKARPSLSKSQVQSRGSSPTVKSRPWEPSQMPGFSLDAPPNLKTTLPERPPSTSRSRPGATSSKSSSIEANSNGKSKRTSITPSRGRASTGAGHINHSSFQALNRSRFIDGDSTESPVVIGTKMVERVVNMRKLAPPKQEDHSTHSNSSGKSNSTGFGSSLSKKSLDMAMRHMDIRRSIQGNLRPLVTRIPASSVYSVRSAGSSKGKTVSVSDSPLATSSTASSEPSVNNSSIGFDGNETEENDFGSERGNSSPTSHHGR